ncbi:MAG TPA: class A beta-lactamase [Thermoanaerobaculia bacterium]|nr:class A beta-lactamase [Thermoanaerobaculia bacterium]
MRIPLFLAVALLASAPADSRLGELQRQIEAIAADTKTTIGVSIVHLESGRRAAVRGGELFQMASVFKVPVAIAVLKAVDAGTLRLDTEVEIRKEDRRTFGPLDDSWKAGLNVSVARMLDVMLVDSDNTATDKLIALVGGPASVQKTLDALGLRGISISLDEKGMGAAIRKDPAAFEAGAWNGATPDAMTALLARLFRGELLSKAGTERLLDAMRWCWTGDRRLRAGVPAGTEVFDKTGTVGRCTNDVGIVTLPDRTHLAVAVFVRGGRDNAAREAVIARVARAAWDAFSMTD